MAETEREPGPTWRRLIEQGWRNIRAANPRQLGITGLMLLAALLIGRFGWEIPVVDEAERSLYDFRAVLAAPQVKQDDRVQIVAYTDQTLIDARKRSPLDRGLLARALRNLDAMGAKAIGIDILFDQPQDEDEELIETLRSMQTPVFIGYAAIVKEEGDKVTQLNEQRDFITYEQQKYLDEFAARLEGSNAGISSILLSYDGGVARQWPRRDPNVPPLLGRKMVAAADGPAKTLDGYEGAIRYRQSLYQDSPVFSALQIDLFANPALADIPELADALAVQIAGRYILIGGEIVDVDRVQTPFTGFGEDPVPGIRIHAHMIAQMLDNARLPSLAAWQLWLIAGLVVVAATLTSLLEARISRVLPFLVLQLLVIGGLPFLLQFQGNDTLGTPAAGWALGWIIAFIGVSSAVRASGAVEREFAQSALGKYLPQDIAQEIIDHPEKLTLSGTKEKLYILFSDLEGFTKLSHQLEPEVVARLLNDYLDRLSAVVLEHGGIIDKYVGDAVVAFWGAPIARPNDARNAALAGYGLWQAGEEFRKSVDPGLPPIGKTRVGMHFGEAVVGNFGGERRIQYTALGDAMNTAARLESGSKALDSAVMASREFAEASGLDWWRPMGKVVLRGRAKPVELYEPTPDFPEADRQLLQEAIDLIASDREKAAYMIQQLAQRHGDDKPLQNLLMRIRNLGDDDAYVLG